MPERLRQTTLVLAIAAAAVLLVGFLAGRDFVRDVFPACHATLTTRDRNPVPPWTLSSSLNRSPMTADPASGPRSTSSGFHLRSSSIFPSRSRRPTRDLVVWNDVDEDGKPATCGSVSFRASDEDPADLRLFHDGASDEFVLKNSSMYGPPADVLTVFVKDESRPARHFQRDRVFGMRHVPLFVVLAALLALGVALLRARLAVAYARTFSTWTEARLTHQGFIEGEGGATLGTLEQSRARYLRPGVVLVAPAALSTSGLYRDMPIVQRKDVAEGTHERWTRGTMLRLRDARVLALLSTASALLAFGARLFAG